MKLKELSDKLLQLLDRGKDPESIVMLDIDTENAEDPDDCRAQADLQAIESGVGHDFNETPYVRLSGVAE